MTTTADTIATLRNPNETTEQSITARVFAGAGVNEPRGLTDAFSPEEIWAIAHNPGAGKWRDRAADILADDDHTLPLYWDELREGDRLTSDGRVCVITSVDPGFSDFVSITFDTESSEPITVERPKSGRIGGCLVHRRTNEQLARWRRRRASMVRYY